MEETGYASWNISLKSILFKKKKKNGKRKKDYNKFAMCVQISVLSVTWNTLATRCGQCFWTLLSISVSFLISLHLIQIVAAAFIYS